MNSTGTTSIWSLFYLLMTSNHKISANIIIKGYHIKIRDKGMGKLLTLELSPSASAYISQIIVVGLSQEPHQQLSTTTSINMGRKLCTGFVQGVKGNGISKYKILLPPVH